MVLRNSLLAFSPYRRNIPLVYTTHLLSKPLFILWCKHNLPNIRSRVSGVWISGILGGLSTAHAKDSVKTALENLENHLCPLFSVSYYFLCFSGFSKEMEEDGLKHTFLDIWIIIYWEATVSHTFTTVGFYIRQKARWIHYFPQKETALQHTPGSLSYRSKCNVHDRYKKQCGTK